MKYSHIINNSDFFKFLCLDRPMQLYFYLENHFFVNGHASTTQFFLAWVCHHRYFICAALQFKDSFLNITQICQLPNISKEKDNVHLSAIDNMYI